MAQYVAQATLTVKAIITTTMVIKERDDRSERSLGGRSGTVCLSMMRGNQEGRK